MARWSCAVLHGDLGKPESSGSLDIRYTPRRGLMYARNTYDIATAEPHHILFFRQALPYISSVDSLDYEIVKEWQGLQEANNAPPTLVGIYFPFEGEQLYETVRQLGWGSVGLRAGIPQYLSTTRSTEIVTDVAIPTFILSIIRQDGFHAKDVEVRTWVPYARVQTEPHIPVRVLTEIKQPIVEDAHGLRGELIFNQSDGGSKFRRLPVAQEAPHSTTDNALADMLYQVNSLGLRVWPIVPLGLLSNGSLEAEWIKWRDTNIALAREVAHAQATSVLAVGSSCSETAQIPPDFIVVSGEDTSEWRFC